MYNLIRQLIKNKQFSVEYSIDTIDVKGLYNLTPIQKELLTSYEFDADAYMYHREDSKYDGLNPIYIRLEFINPDTKEELTFTWEN